MEVTHNTSTNYAYKTWFDVMASFSPEVKKYRLEDGGSYFFQPESTNDFEKYEKSAVEDEAKRNPISNVNKIYQLPPLLPGLKFVGHLLIQKSY